MLDIKEMKDVEFYSANVNAWFNTRFEHDKSLLTLSAGAVGLLITLISSVGVRTIDTLIIFILALQCFIVCLGSLLWIFKRNAKYLEDVLNKPDSTHDPLLNILDRIAVASFMFGVILSSMIGISTAVHSYIEKAHVMTDKTKVQSSVMLQDSINGITSMRSAEQGPKSVNGILNMKPDIPQSTPTPTPTPTPTQSD